MLAHLHVVARPIVSYGTPALLHRQDAGATGLQRSGNSHRQDVGATYRRLPWAGRRASLPLFVRGPGWRRCRVFTWICCVVVLVCAGPAEFAQADPPSWQSVAISGTNQSVLAAVEFDEGAGPALYVGGDFSTAGGVSAIRVARYNGQQWSALGAGFASQVTALTAFAPAGGSASLYAGGLFSGGVARWNGVQWTTVGTAGLTGGTVAVSAMTVFDDDGAGPNPPYLLVTGTFTHADGIPVQNVAKWDGASWSAGPGYGGQIMAMQVFNGSAPAMLYGGALTNGLLRLTGTSWSNYTWTNLGVATNTVRSLCQYAPASGNPAIIYGGDFLKPAAPGNRIARYDGTAATAVGTGVGMEARVYTLTSFGDTSPLLIAGGSFTSVDGTSMSRIACWDGTAWSGILGGANNSVRALTTVHLGGEALLAVGGAFTTAGGASANYIWLLRRLLAPTITHQPADQTVAAGQTATFTVAASGSGTLSYRWYKGAEALSDNGYFSGTAGATLTVSNVDASVTGQYSCQVTNSVGSATSNEATLAIMAAGVLEVTPAGAFASCGYAGQWLSPTSQEYTVTNTGQGALNWTAGAGQSWVDLSSAAGPLAPSESTVVTVSLNGQAEGLAAGSYGDTVSFTNTTNGTGSTTRTVSLTVKKVGDADGDGGVDVSDLLEVAQTWGLLSGAPGFDVRCDFNGDGRIDVSDVLMLAGNWGD